jgi:hypothetical protein
MNKENAHLFLPLIQALADGKTIQRALHFGTNDVRWEDVHEFKWTYSPDQYRIKPEPRTWDVLISKDEKIISRSSIDSLMEGTQYIKVREVLE